jgi:dUTP pyrophosphatase
MNPIGDSYDPFRPWYTCTTCGAFYQGFVHMCSVTMPPTDWHLNTPVFTLAQPPTAKITLLAGATMPTYGTPNSIGFDFSASEMTIIAARTRKLVPTGLLITPPEGYWLQIAARSSLIKRGLILANGIGIVDPDYCGINDQIMISLYNVSEEGVIIHQGERIAQGFFQLIPPQVTWSEISLEQRDAEAKSRGGFGSTGL